ncbi:MAG: 50S ribosomal protein L9 [Verrucomicrobiae bacterium]|nr:50S ribosomal protein L9 [Verrucomicrobiae bacterium]
MSTQIILTTKVEHLGDEGTTVKVADGYARNFLFPKGLAMPASAANLKRIESLRKKREAEHAAELAAAKELESKLTKGTITISAPAGADEKLFGSVTAADIVEALAKEGITIDRKKVVLEHPIRACGHYDVDIKLHASVATKAKIWVVAAEGGAPAVAPVVPAPESPKKSKKK